MNQLIKKMVKVWSRILSKLNFPGSESQQLAYAGTMKIKLIKPSSAISLISIRKVIS